VDSTDEALDTSEQGGEDYHAFDIAESAFEAFHEARLASEADTDEDEDEDEDADSGELTDADEAAVLSEKQLEKRSQQLERENARHAKRLGEIMESDADDLIPCPVCMDGIAGWIFPPDVQQLSEEAISRVRQVIGLPDYSTFLDAPDAEKCSECGGKGSVKTGSDVQGYETKTCRKCQGAGWTGKGLIVSNGPAATTTAEIVTGPTMATADSGDPAIRNLQERGFVVIPPMTMPGT
jgi:hypothetical protein